MQDEGARAALCAGGWGQSHHVCEMKGPGQPCERGEGILPQLFYLNITFLTLLIKVRNVRNVMLRVAVVVKK